MAESETNRLPSHGAPITSRGLLEEISSFLLFSRGKLLSFRRKQILIMLAIVVVAAVVLQISGQSFSHKLKTGSLNASPSETIDNNERVGLDRPPSIAKKTVPSSTDNVERADNAERNQVATPSCGTTKTDDMGNESMGEESQRQSSDSSSIAPSENEHNKVLTQRNKDDKETSSVAERTEQVRVKETEQQKAQQGSGTLKSAELDSPITTEQTHTVSIKDDYKGRAGNEHSYYNTAEKQEVDEAEGDKNKGEDELAIAHGGSTLDKPGIAVNETANTPDSSQHDVSRNKTNSTSIDSTEDVIHNLQTNQLVKEIGCTRTKCYSVSGEARLHTCAPSVVVAGYEKCGTSALYYKLTLHPEIVAHPKWKENCPAEDSLKEMWSWFENIPVLEDSESSRLLLNGCIGIVSKPLILKELQRLNPNLKILVALRNYADWSYSFYGYRCYPDYDEGCEKLEKEYSYGPWKETRTPENFAKLVTDIEEAGKSPYEIFEVIQPNVYLFRPWLEELLDIVGPNAVKIIKQEDLSFRPRETLAAVARFLQIDSEQFPDDAYTLVSNTKDHPAEISSVNVTATKAEMSHVMNSGAAILNETRSVLNKFWNSECEWLRDNFDVHFSDVC